MDPEDRNPRSRELRNSEVLPPPPVYSSLFKLLLRKGMLRAIYKYNIHIITLLLSGGQYPWFRFE